MWRPSRICIGPSVLFYLYALKNCKVKLYADDTVLYQAGNNATEAACSLQADLNLFSHWCAVNKLTVNTAKSKMMVFGSRSKIKKAKNAKLYLSGDSLKKVPTFKYLGVILDSTLNFKHHISSVLKTVLHKLLLLSKLRVYLNNNVAVQIYKSMILPYFDYADVIYSNSNSGDLDKLQRVQNRCLKVCTGLDRRYSTNRAHKLASVPFLKDRRAAHLLNFMFIRKSKPNMLNIREIRTRAHDAPLFDIGIPRCEAFKRSVGYFGAVAWNNLSPEVRNTDLYPVFKFHRRKEMIEPLNQLALGV